MSNTDHVLEMLTESYPQEFCDDCISKELGIFPRQQINLICRVLVDKGLVIRQNGKCKLCNGDKIVNSFKHEQPQIVFLQNNLQTLTKKKPVTMLNEDEVKTHRDEIATICNKISPYPQDPKNVIPLAGLIILLRNDGFIPRLQANMMLTICNLRNISVYDGMKLGDRELVIASNAWSIIEDWYKSINIS